MIIEYDETFFNVKLYHSIYDTKPYKVINVEDMVSLWLEKECENDRNRETVKS